MCRHAIRALLLRVAIDPSCRGSPEVDFALMSFVWSKPVQASRKPRPARRRVISAETLIPKEASQLELNVAGHSVKLTNLKKVFWPERGFTKGDLLRYYVEVSPYLLPHLAGRAMVLKRYPNGAAGKFFFQKRAPEPRPDWIDICPIRHAAAGLVDFAIGRDLASLLLTVNLGCIDLTPWSARCYDPQRPDYLPFDLDPVEG